MGWILFGPKSMWPRGAGASIWFSSLHLVASLAATLDYELDNIDVATAFLHAPLEEDIYIRVPQGYPHPPQDRTLVNKLHRQPGWQGVGVPWAGP